MLPVASAVVMPRGFAPSDAGAAVTVHVWQPQEAVPAWAAFLLGWLLCDPRSKGDKSGPVRKGTCRHDGLFRFEEMHCCLTGRLYRRVVWGLHGRWGRVIVVGLSVQCGCSAPWP